MWIEKSEKSKYRSSAANGIRLKFLDGVSLENESVCRYFCKWLRNKYWFPIRCNIEFYATKKFKAEDGHYFYGTFIDNEGTNYYSRIAIATKFENEEDEYFCLFTIAHELTHYFQWYLGFTETWSHRRLEYNASQWARYLTDTFYMEVKDK